MIAHLDAAQRARVSLLNEHMHAISTAPRRGQAIANAAAATGLSAKRIETLFYTWLDTGDTALIERRKLPRGRTSHADCIDLTADERQRLRQLSLKCDSRQFAIEAFADDPATRDELRVWIAGYRASRNYPKPLLAAARITAEDRAQARGHRTFSLRAHTQLRSNTYLDDQGEHQLTGGDLFECDDMSLNQPFWYEWPYGGDPLSDTFGVRLGRQMLASIDTATGKWIGFDLVGRVRDAYRAEDVVRFLGRIAATHGLPRLGFRLERGVWMSNTVRGVQGTTDEGERQTIGSIRDIVDIHYVYSPKAKGVIEGSFDNLQTALALHGLQVGRKRGEYEAATKLALACAAARRHPADCGFPHISEAVERVNAAMNTLDARPKLGRLLTGIPQERFTAALTERPLARIPDERAHLFMPVKQIRPIDAGHVRIRVPHYDHLFSFAVPGECAHLGNKYQLLVCFDPADPHAGAHVLDAESDRCRDYHATPGQSYGIFPFAADAPQLDRRTVRSPLDSRPSTKRNYLAAARTHFRATGMVTGTGASIDQVADGHGNTARVERGTGGTASGLSVERSANPHAASALQARREHIDASAPATSSRQRRDLAAFDAAALLGRDDDDF